MCNFCRRWKVWLTVIASIIVCLVTAWVYIHRRLIRALIRNEEKPECPHWLPDCLYEEPETPSPAPEEE